MNTINALDGKLSLLKQIRKQSPSFYNQFMEYFQQHEHNHFYGIEDCLIDCLYKFKGIEVSLLHNLTILVETKDGNTQEYESVEDALLDVFQLIKETDHYLLKFQTEVQFTNRKGDVMSLKGGDVYATSFEDAVEFCEKYFPEQTVIK